MRAGREEGKLKVGASSKRERRKRNTFRWLESTQSPCPRSESPSSGSNLLHSRASFLLCSHRRCSERERKEKEKSTQTKKKKKKKKAQKQTNLHSPGLQVQPPKEEGIKNVNLLFEFWFDVVEEISAKKGCGVRNGNKIKQLKNQKTKKKKKQQKITANKSLWHYRWATRAGLTGEDRLL